ncbi:RNA polymerase II positive regulator [Malassezia pachydermatis]
MSNEALGFVSSSASQGAEGSSEIVSLEPLDSSSQHTPPVPYTMHSATGKTDGTNLGFQNGHPPAYSHGASGKKDGSEVDAHTAAAMDPSLTGQRRADNAQASYTDHVSRAFPFLSNSIGAQDGDSRSAIFSPNFSGMGAAQDANANNLAYKKQGSESLPGASVTDSNAGLHSKAQRGPSYDSLAPPEKKETPYSRSPSLRVTHKIAERKRRKEMKDLFDELKEYVPVDRGPKTSKGDILSKAVLQFQTMHREREQLIEALEAAHHEINQLRQVAGNTEHANSSLSQHVYPHSSTTAAAPSYLPRPPESRLHGMQEQHVSLPRSDKADTASHTTGVNLQPGAQRSGEQFLSELRLDRLRQSHDAVHPNFKQLDHGANVLDQSLNGARSFQPESYQTSLVSTELPAGQEASTMSSDAAAGSHTSRAM